MPVVLPFKLKIWFYRKNPCEPVKKFVRCQIDKLLQDTGGGGGRHVEMLVERLGGPVALQTSSDGRDGTVAEKSDFCGARSGMGRID